MRCAAPVTPTATRCSTRSCRPDRVSPSRWTSGSTCGTTCAALTGGGRARVITERGAVEATVEISDMMQPGHVSLPNGLGVDHPEHGSAGVAPNQLTSLAHKDFLAGTPWHKHVPARVEAIAESV